MTRARDTAAAACIAGAGFGAVLIIGAGVHPALATIGALTVTGLLGSVLAVATIDNETPKIHPVPDDLRTLADVCRVTRSYTLTQLEDDCADIAHRFDRLRRNDRKAGMR